MIKCGIICEYNPFHNGHKYHLQKTKEILGDNSNIICVMSGDFTQRGEAAIFDKAIRAEAALNCGADAVIQLPVLYSTAPAEIFAYGAIKILSYIKGLKYLSFGVETEDTNLLEEIALIQIEESDKMQENIKHLLSMGLSYPNCLSAATAKELGNSEKILNILSRPNNVLAIEYLKAIKLLNLDIKPIYIRRIDKGYNSKELIPPFASASAIRTLIERGQDILDFVPINYPKTNLDKKTLEKILILSLINNEIPKAEGLELSLKNAAKNFTTLAEIIESVKSKRYTYARINRLILATLLGINQELYNYKGDFLFDVLGVKKSFKENIKDLESFAVIKKSKKPFINESAEKIYNLDKLASDVYAVITGQSANRFYKKLLEV